METPTDPTEALLLRLVEEGKVSEFFTREHAGVTLTGHVTCPVLRDMAALFGDLLRDAYERGGYAKRGVSIQAEVRTCAVYQPGSTALVLVAVEGLATRGRGRGTMAIESGLLLPSAALLLPFVENIAQSFAALTKGGRPAEIQLGVSTGRAECCDAVALAVALCMSLAATPGLPCDLHTRWIVGVSGAEATVVKAFLCSGASMCSGPELIQRSMNARYELSCWATPDPAHAFDGAVDVLLSREEVQRRFTVLLCSDSELLWTAVAR